MNSNPKILFVDGFCGPGRYIKGEEGSPLIALNIAKEQLIKCPQREVVLLFIDQDQDRIEFLKITQPIFCKFESKISTVL
jgi:three-Cys-motif partner protein